MSDSDYVPFLINDRSSALLHFIDTCQFTESELHDIYDGIFNRMKDYFSSGDRKQNEIPVEIVAFFDDQDSKDSEILHEMKPVDEFGNPCDLEDLLDDLDDRESGFSDA